MLTSCRYKDPFSRPIDQPAPTKNLLEQAEMVFLRMSTLTSTYMFTQLAAHTHMSTHMSTHTGPHTCPHNCLHTGQVLQRRAAARALQAAASVSVGIQSHWPDSPGVRDGRAAARVGMHARARARVCAWVSGLVVVRRGGGGAYVCMCVCVHVCVRARARARMCECVW